MAKKEVTLNANSFNQNPQFSGELAILRQVYNLVVMKKGTDPLNPDKGCDVNRYYYAFKDDVDLRALEQEIKDQVKKYTDYQLNNVSCQTMKQGNKWILHVILAISAFEQKLIVSTNGDITKMTVLDSVSKDIISDIERANNQT